MENSEGHIELIGLNKHQVTNQEEAMNFLFLGDTNRTIAETPMNLASSRSHCVFTIYVDSKKEGLLFILFIIY